MNTPSVTQPFPPVTKAHLQEFGDKGFTVLERAIPDDLLALLRDICARAIGRVDARADAQNQPRSTKYFASVWKDEPEIRRFTFSPLMANITRSFLGDTVFLSFEQCVVKAAEKGGTFAWHQDSSYVPTPHPLYLTCWCALDDVTEENGTVYMLPTIAPERARSCRIGSARTTSTSSATMATTWEIR